jgi:hypothetical protein
LRRFVYPIYRSFSSWRRSITSILTSGTKWPHTAMSSLILRLWNERRGNFKQDHD